MKAIGFALDALWVGSGDAERVETFSIKQLLRADSGPAPDKGATPNITLFATSEIAAAVQRRGSRLPHRTTPQIAQKMQESKRRIPHFSYVEEIDVTSLEEVRAQLNDRFAARRGKLTLLPSSPGRSCSRSTPSRR